MVLSWFNRFIRGVISQMEISRHWRLRKQRYSMIGGECPNCQTKMFPVRMVCPNCGHGADLSIRVDESDSLFVQPVAVPSQTVSI